MLGTMGERVGSKLAPPIPPIVLIFAVNALGPGAGIFISGPNAAATRRLQSERGQECGKVLLTGVRGRKLCGCRRVSRISA